jgi:hypothetical protein
MVMSIKKIYLAGPMSGIPEFNFPAFYEVADKFRAAGWIVFNPADKEGETLSEESRKNGDPMQAQKDGFNFRDVYLWDVTKVIESDAIYMLPGWENSPGARGEHAVAVAMKRHYPDYQIYYKGEDIGEYWQAARQRAA